MTSSSTSSSSHNHHQQQQHQNNNYKLNKFTAICVFFLALMQVLYLPKVALPTTEWNIQFSFVALPTMDNINNNNNSDAPATMLLPLPSSSSQNNINANAAAVAPSSSSSSTSIITSVVENIIIVNATNSNNQKEEKKHNDNMKKNLDYLDDSATTPSSRTNEGGGNDDNNDDEMWWKKTVVNSKSLLQDIDVHKLNETFCGNYKCYYRSLSQPDYGYLIGQRRSRYKSNVVNFNLQNLQYSYDLAVTIEQEYGNDIHHFMVSPPIPMNCSMKLTEIINVGVTSYSTRFPKKDRQFNFPFRETKPGHYKRDRLIVQVMKNAPQPNLIIHMLQVNRLINKSQTVFDLPQASNFFFILNDDNNGTTTTSIFNSSKHDNQKFHNNLKKDWNVTCQMLTNHPMLYYDFQFMLDQFGHIYHIDFDRAYVNQRPVTNSTNEKHINITNIIQKLIIDPLLEASKQATTKTVTTTNYERYK